MKRFKRKCKILVFKIFIPFKNLFLVLKRERIFRIIGIALLVLSLCALSIYVIEYQSVKTSIKTVGDAFWWALVTITTVGYGDKVPDTWGGKIVGLVLMFSGIVLLSIITATIASAFVHEKIKEERGLETIKDRDHIVICGWNSQVEKVIKGFLRDDRTKKKPIVLVNELSMDEIDAVRSKYQKHGIKFIRGNFLHEDVLNRANIKRAKCAIVLADTSGDHSLHKADERTVLGTLAIKTMAPNVRTCAELLSTENRQHLKRANVDEIIVRDEHIGEILAGAAVQPGFSKAVSHLLSYDGGQRLQKMEIPSRFAGKAYKELIYFLKESHNAIIIGLLTEKKSLQLEDILSEDATAIDMFIKKKFEESDKDYFPGKEGIEVIINPEDDHIITRNDSAIVIAGENAQKGKGDG